MPTVDIMDKIGAIITKIDAKEWDEFTAEIAGVLEDAQRTIEYERAEHQETIEQFNLTQDALREAFDHSEDWRELYRFPNIRAVVDPGPFEANDSRCVQYWTPERKSL